MDEEIAVRVEALLHNWRFTAKARKEWFQSTSGEFCTAFVRRKAIEQAEKERAGLTSEIF